MLHSLMDALETVQQAITQQHLTQETVEVLYTT